jgi:hypothetical protein
MSAISNLFPLRELKTMDKQDLEMLHDAIQHYVHTSPEIRKILRTKVRPLYDKLKQPKGRARAKKGSRPKA